MKLTGTKEERVAAVQFARKHGGFKNCQLIRYNGFPFDTSQMPLTSPCPMSSSATACSKL